VTHKGHGQEFVDFCFAAYLQQPAPRSLARLHRHLTEAGVKISVPTLKRYSREYAWQQRIAETAKVAREHARQRSVESVLAMQDRHSQLARAMQGAGGTALQRLLANDSRLSGLKAGDIARLIDLGFRSERHAVGVATDRRDIAVEICNDLVVDLVAVFMEINDEPEARVRARLFARSVDRLVTERLEALKRKDGDNQ